MTYYLEVDEERTGGEALDPSDRWTSYEDTHVTATFRGIYRSQQPNGFNIDFVSGSDWPMYHFDTIEPGQKAHLVVVRYSTGDTFSHTTGVWRVVAVCAEEWKAQEIEARVLSGKNEGSVPWNGYFEAFESVDIYTFVMGA